MTTVAYSYSDPLLESPPVTELWGEEVERIYQDLGDRHQLHQLIEDCKDSIVSIGIDRVLLRSLDELGDTIEDVSNCLHAFHTLGITLIPLDSSLDNLDDSSQNTTEPAAVLTLFRTIQKSQTTRRIQLGHARNRVKALPPPGKAPYGYRRGKDRYALDRSAAPVVKDFVEHFLLYGSLRGSVRYLANKHKKKISVSTGQRWLTSPVYRGNLAYHNGDVVPDTHLAIISREEAAQVDRLLRRNRTLPTRTASAPRSLAGLVKCGTCQSAMKITRTTSRGKSKEYLYVSPVRCPYRDHLDDKLTSSDTSSDTSSGESLLYPDNPYRPCRSIPYEQLLNKTIQRICDDLPKAVANTNLPDLDTIKQRIQQQIEARELVLSQLPELQRSGVLDAETADLRAYIVRTEIAELRKKRDQLPPVNLTAIAQTVSIQQFWLDLSEAERRFYFREFIDCIQIIRSGKEIDRKTGSSDDWQLKLIFMF